MIRQMRSRAPFDLSDALGVIGLVSLAYGLGLIWLPLAFIVAGVLLLVYVVLLSLPPRGET